MLLRDRDGYKFHLHHKTAEILFFDLARLTSWVEGWWKDTGNLSSAIRAPNSIFVDPEARLEGLQRYCQYWWCSTDEEREKFEDQV